MSSTRSERRPAYRPLFQDFDLESYYAENGDRYYITPHGDFESVTTLLGRYSEQDKSGLDRWKQRIGEEAALSIMRASGRKGTDFHLMAESFLRGDEDYREGKMPHVLELFRSVEWFLRKIDVVYGLEQALYSRSLRMAGRADCVAAIGGRNLLVDFKNARTRKKKEWVHDYFLQSTAYSLMLAELFDFRVEAFAVLVANSDATSDVFVEDPRNFVKDPFFWKVYNR